jgi:hypothetical protein
MKNGPPPSSFWGAYALILLVVIMLGFRGVMAMGSVLHGARATSINPGVSPDQGSDAVGALENRDSLLTSARIEGRDPFSNPVIAPQVTATERREAKPRQPEIPGLRALLYDGVKPVARLILGNSESDWLHVGESFQGWVVTDIRPNQVMISKDGQQIVLRPS